MLSARDAYEFPAAPLVPCLNCRQLILTGAALVEAFPVTTTRGLATAPVWVYQVEGSTVRLTRPAVGVTVPSLPHPAYGLPYQLPVLGARGSLTAPSLTGTVLGAWPSGDQPCGADYAAEALESVTAVVLVVHEVRHLNRAPHAACNLAVVQRLVTATLHQPLGDRTVLDGVSGQPVPTVRTP